MEEGKLVDWDLDGTRKSKVIKIIKLYLIHRHGSYESRCCLVTTTRKAATIINGCAIYSYEERLRAIASNQCTKSSQCALDSIVDRFKNNKLIVLDKVKRIIFYE